MNEKNDGNKTKGWIGRYIKILVIILLVLSASGYYLYKNSTRMGLTKPALVVTITTGLTKTGGPMITNATFEQSSVAFFYKTADSPAEFPEIDANVRINQLQALPSSYWSSTRYKGEGTYTLRIFFKEGKRPNNGDILIIPMRIISRTGAVAYKTTAFWVWE